MRLLLVTYAALKPELGAGQTALNLGDALAARGHEVVLWSPQAPPPSIGWWRLRTWQAAELERYVAGAAPFDAIDLPPIAAGPRLAAMAPLIVRSVQPDLQYLAAERRGTRSAPLRRAAHAAHHSRLRARIVRGWRSARVILCLGSAEAAWMARHAPWTRSRLAVYVIAPAAAEQERFAALRARRAPAAGPGVRFLWIGRWSAHKGVGPLVRFAAARLAASPHDSFTFAGCGPAALAALPEALRREPRLRVVPSFQRDELADLLAGHDAGLFTSAVEGWGLCLNEMLESGMPVFATPAGGVADLTPYFPRALRPFPPPRDVDLTDPADRLEANGYYDRFTWDRIAERYEALAARALGVEGAPRAGE